MANLLAKLPDLIEQTVFLLQRQKDAQQDCSSMFKDLLIVVKAKRAGVVGDNEEGQALDQIHDLVSDQVENVVQEAQVDIDFLTEQLASLQKIQQIKDPSQANEVLSMLIDSEEDIRNTAEFKKEVSEEAAISRENLMTMISDIKDSIKEGGAKEVALYLESILEGAEEEGLEIDMDEDDEEEDGCCDDDEEGGCCDEEEEAELKPCTCGKGQGGMCTCKSDGKQRMTKVASGGGCGGGCSGCSGGGCGSGCGSKKTDLFGDLEKYEKALLAEADEKTRH